MPRILLADGRASMRNTPRNLLTIYGKLDACGEATYGEVSNRRRYTLISRTRDKGGFPRALPSLAIFREAPRGIHESVAVGNTTTTAVSTEPGWQYQRFAASDPIAKDRVPL